jgi:hypothetical protein
MYSKVIKKKKKKKKEKSHTVEEMCQCLCYLHCYIHFKAQATNCVTFIFIVGLIYHDNFLCYKQSDLCSKGHIIFNKDKYSYLNRTTRLVNTKNSISFSSLDIPEFTVIIIIIIITRSHY